METEGTNESLADLQERCGPGAFPPRVGGVRSSLGNDRDSRLVFRILREKRFVFFVVGGFLLMFFFVCLVGLGRFGFGLWGLRSG